MTSNQWNPKSSKNALVYKKFYFHKGSRVEQCAANQAIKM